MNEYKEMYEAAKKTGALESLSPKYFEFKKAGDGFVGKLLAVSPVASTLADGTYNQYTFDTDDGLIKCAMGAATDKESGALMEVGGVYSVSFKGSEKITGGRKVNKFKVELVNLVEMGPVGEGDAESA